MDGASSSSDDGGDETPDEARFIEEMYKAHEKLKVDPETARQMEIVAEVARRREQDEPERLRHKSDAIFGRFDADADGKFSEGEIAAAAAAVGLDVTIATPADSGAGSAASSVPPSVAAAAMSVAAAAVLC